MSAQRGEFALQLIDDLKYLRHFLLAQEIDLQVEVRAVLRALRHAILSNEDGDRQQQGIGAHQPLQPEERRRVEGMQSGVVRPSVEQYPNGDKCDCEGEIGRAAEEGA